MIAAPTPPHEPGAVIIRAMADLLKKLAAAVGSRWSAAAYHERLDAPPGSPRARPRWLPWRHGLGSTRDASARGLRRFDRQSFNERLERRGR
jgi:hypothetical protein